jgi:hypothetical protein
MKRSIPFALVLLACLIPAAPASAAEKAPEGDPVWRAYPLHYLDVREAGLLIESRVPEMLMHEERSLRYEVLGGTSFPGDARPRGYLKAFAEDGLQDRIAAILAESDHPPQTHVFHVVLLEASSEASGVPDVSAGARAALEELRGLLPFKGYRLIDSALVRSSGRSEVSLGEGFDLRFAFRIGPSSDKPLEVEEFAMYSRLVEGHPAQMQTSFSAGIGETVVVGTSTPQDKRGALVVLMTAVE